MTLSQCDLYIRSTTTCNVSRSFPVSIIQKLKIASFSAIALAPLSLTAQHANHSAPSVAASAAAGPGVYELASDGKGSLYVAYAGSRDKPGGGLIEFDATTLKEKRRIALPDAAPYGVGMNTKTGVIYTTNTRAGNVTAVEAATGKVLATISDPLDPKAHLFRVFVDEATNTIYTSVTGGRIWVIDGKTNAISRIYENIGATTIGLALDRANNQLFAANMGHNQIAVVDLTSGRVVRRINTDGVRSSIVAFDSASSRLFVTNQQTGNLSVIDVKENVVEKVIPTGGGALGVSFEPKQGRLYVTNRQAGTVSVIDSKSLEKIADIPVAGYPNTVTVDATGAVFVTSKLKSAEGSTPAGDTVSRLKP